MDCWYSGSGGADGRLHDGDAGWQGEKSCGSGLRHGGDAYADTAGLDYASFSRSYTRLRLEAGEFFGELEGLSENLTGRIIEEACSAYILDKGAKLGIRDLAVWVSARQCGDGYWYPYAATLTTDADKELRERLSYVIRAELGIPPEELIWRMYHHEG
jgi:hypothetical protein